MTALPQYERLEAPALWREAPEAQRREVIVFFGDATLVIADGRSAQPLGHWSLPALVRRNPGRRPAVFAPSEEQGEELEIEDDLMIAAIDKVLSAIAAARPHPGRLRGWLIGAALAAAIAAVAVWSPPAIVAQAARVASDGSRNELGRAVLEDMTRITGGAVCHSTAGDAALTTLATRIADKDEPITIAILPRGLTGARLLPGGVYAVSGAFLKSKDPADALAGAVIVARASAAANPDPTLTFMQWAGARAALRFLMTGDLPRGSARGYGATVLAEKPARADDQTLLTAFATASAPSSPWAYVADPTGETTLGLIEADPLAGKPNPRPALKQSEAKALAQICD